MPTLDELFPRGGAPTLSDNKDGKRAKAPASVEVGLFGGSKSAGGEGAPQKRWRTVDDAPSGVVGDLMDDARLEVVAQGNAVVKAAKGKPARMKPATFKSHTKGVLTLGIVRSVGDSHAVIALPGSLTGHVSSSEASDAEEPDDEPEVNE